ncbi:rabankyrin-5-like isoform X2 [Patiria miniata]|uniref:Ankyrin repeat and FYVE domain-containing protein 1 n=1 Tax=Patiria miniata TaxID=46514 RepID=A0A914BFQ6_PATMI|nr:rabankyrin-5-like isoform X1 [Patiria miniata]XP_038074757.1 rabankyrin-5-like isoform X2 [Patiria miniata]
MSDAEVEKLQRHLDLLRQEYVKLQNRLVEVEQKYNVATATAQGGRAGGADNEENFVSRLLGTIADLFDKELYSDLVVYLDGKEIKAHRFVLAARSTHWGVPNLSEVNTLDFTGIPYDIGMALLKWVYTDKLDMKPEDSYVLGLMKAASKFKLAVLRDRCEKALMSSVNVRNCIRYYQTAEEIGATSLKAHCSELISTHWNDFTSNDFVNMTAPLLYKMFKAKTPFPLHHAIRNRREDIVFLYLMEFDALLPDKLDEIDERGDLPLDLALSTQQEGIANELVKHKVDIDRADSMGRSLLHKAVKRGDKFSAFFLIQADAKVNAATLQDKETALHMAASYSPLASPPELVADMTEVATKLLQHGANPDQQDSRGNSALHRAVASRNQEIFDLLLSQKSLNLDLQNGDGDSSLWLALDPTLSSQGYGEDSFAAKLIRRGCSADSVNLHTGDSLLHRACRLGLPNEDAALFLATSGASTNLANFKGEAPLHSASMNGLALLVSLLLQKGANPNAQTKEDVLGKLEQLTTQEDGPSSLMHASKQTPLHMAIANQHSEVVSVFLEHRTNAMQSQDGVLIIPDFNMKDSNDQTVLGLALWTGLHNFAAQLLHGGANINCMTLDGLTLLHMAISKQDTQSALFLLEHQADINIRSRDGETPLQLAIKRHLPVVVDALCVRGANMNTPDESGNPPLWVALESGQEDVASTLVRHGCDTTAWGPGFEGCQQTLLHKAIDENNEAVACFLIRSMCDVNSPRRPGPHGEGGMEAKDGQGPLHRACEWGQELVVQCLVEQQADVNAKDAEGKTPLHIAISNQHPAIISLLMSHPLLDLTLRDRGGLTPFAAAMTFKNNKAAQAILDREPRAAEQLDNKGRNFLHIAIQKSDIESVLFLISVHANVNSSVQDSTKLTPLHLAVQAGSEIIVRNLLLAGAAVQDADARKQTALHHAAAVDQPSIISVLIENGILVDAVDDNSNNALHIAVQHGNLGSSRTLLTESQINAESYNAKGKTPMHILGDCGRDNAAAIFELFKECMPNYPVDKQDADGNTVLLLAYQKGNGALCRAIVRSGASLGILNKNGTSIFNAQVATKQLLFRLLDMLSSEPAWSESEICQECQVKFTIKTRKHHCRHCGRILCNKCSSKMVPIIKYDQTKPVRTCDVCFDVLSLGGQS